MIHEQSQGHHVPILARKVNVCAGRFANVLFKNWNKCTPLNVLFAVVSEREDQPVILRRQFDHCR